MLNVDHLLARGGTCRRIVPLRLKFRHCFAAASSKTVPLEEIGIHAAVDLERIEEDEITEVFLAHQAALNPS